MNNIQPLNFKKNVFNLTDADNSQFTRLIGYRDNLKKPVIISEKIVDRNKKVPLEYSVKKLSNGDTFESYNLRGNKIKLIKDRLGNLVSFKTNVKNYKIDNFSLIENMKTLILDTVSSYLKPSYNLRIIK